MLPRSYRSEGCRTENSDFDKALSRAGSSRPLGAPCGTDTKGVLATIFGTWKLSNLNPFFACRDLLLSPQI
jgi:hypothetical protein